MKKLLSVLTATILAAAFAMPLNAAPMFVPKPEQVRADVVEKVKQRKYYRNWRGDRRWHRRQAWRYCGYNGNCYPRRYYAATATTIGPTIRATTRATIGLTIRATTLARELAFI